MLTSALELSVIVLVAKSALTLANGSTSLIALVTVASQWPHVMSGTANFVISILQKSRGLNQLISLPFAVRSRCIDRQNIETSVDLPMTGRFMKGSIVIFGVNK